MGYAKYQVTYYDVNSGVFCVGRPPRKTREVAEQDAKELQKQGYQTGGILEVWSEDDE